MSSFGTLLTVTGIFLKTFGVTGERDINREHKPYYKTNAAAIVYFSVPTRELADNLSRALIRERLVACVNVLPDITAVFPTNNDEIKAEIQTMLIAKSATSRIQEVVGFVKKHHPDSMPDIVATPIRTGNGLFLEWVLSVVPPQVKKCLLANSTETKTKTKNPTKIKIPKVQNVNEPVDKGDIIEPQDEEQNENGDNEPPMEDQEDKEEANYGSENSNNGNDPNESHANSYP